MRPRPPLSAMAMAMRDSVTVSMSDGNDRDVQVQIFRELRVELRVAREDFRIQRGQRDVVKRQADLVVCREKLIRRLVERIVEGWNCALLPCRKMPAERRLWQEKFNPDSRSDFSDATPTRSPRCPPAWEISAASRVRGWPCRRRPRAGADRRRGAVFPPREFFCP